MHSKFQRNNVKSDIKIVVSHWNWLLYGALNELISTLKACLKEYLLIREQSLNYYVYKFNLKNELFPVIHCERITYWKKMYYNYIY